jgi:hypothetical protein
VLFRRTHRRHGTKSLCQGRAGEGCKDSRSPQAAAGVSFPLSESRTSGSKGRGAGLGLEPDQFGRRDIADVRMPAAAVVYVKLCKSLIMGCMPRNVPPSVRRPPRCWPSIQCQQSSRWPTVDRSPLGGFPLGTGMDDVRRLGSGLSGRLTRSPVYASNQVLPRRSRYKIS